MLIQIYGVTAPADAEVVIELAPGHVGFVLDEGLDAWDSVDVSTARAIVSKPSTHVSDRGSSTSPSSCRRSDVRTVHSQVVELGNQVLHEPEEFPQYPPPYFATFWLDPFGFMLEAVCHQDRD